MALPSLFNNNGTGPAEQPKEKLPATAAPAAQKEITELAPNVVAQKITVALEKATVNWPEMTKKSVACSAALSKVQSIESDEEDQAAEKLLVKSRATYVLINKMRAETTSEFDSIKSIMMEPEKKISILPGEKDSGFNRVKALRDGWANKKLAKQRAEAAEALRLENETLELTRLKGEFELTFFNNVADYLATMETNISTYFSKLVLTDADGKPKWDEMIKKFSVTPAIKVETFEKWFELPFDKNKLTQEKYDEFVDQIKAVFTYDAINGTYVEQAQPKIDAWKAKLPAKKIELEEMEALKLKDAKAAALLLKKQQAAADKETKKITAQAEAEKAEKAKEVQTAQRNETLGAQFETLKVTQNQEEISGKIKRLPIINSPIENIVEVFSMALYHCFIHPDFEGYLKKDKATGEPLPADENGMPQYAAWALPILKFVAEKTDVQIKGIEFKEIISTSQRTKKGEAE